jgi:hypothetical protein
MKKLAVFFLICSSTTIIKSCRKIDLRRNFRTRPTAEETEEERQASERRIARLIILGALVSHHDPHLLLHALGIHTVEQLATVDQLANAQAVVGISLYVNQQPRTEPEPGIPAFLVRQPSNA